MCRPGTFGCLVCKVFQRHSAAFLKAISAISLVLMINSFLLLRQAVYGQSTRPLYDQTSIGYYFLIYKLGTAAPFLFDCSSVLLKFKALLLNVIGFPF